MTLALTSDPSHAAGGYAFLEFDGPVPAELAFEDRSTGLFLASGGKWSKRQDYFRVETVDETRVRLGPEIVDHVEADMIIMLHAPDRLLGVLVWPAIRPSAGAASGDVMPDVKEMAIIGAVLGNHSAQTTATANAASVADDLTPLPAPPPPPVPPPVRVDFKPPAQPPLKPAAPRKWVLLINGLLLLILGLAAFRGTDVARQSVCESTGALHGLEFLQNFVSCQGSAADPEELAYNDYLQCVPGKPACLQKNCGDVYLSAFANGAHAPKVRTANEASQKACDVEFENKNAADVFAAFNECMRTTSNVCKRSQCVERYRSMLTAEPYASSLRQSAETAANDCARSKEDAAFSQFNSCVAGAAPCDTARCASAFTSAFPNSAYISRVLQTTENAARTCAAERPVVQQQAPRPEPSPQPQMNSTEQAVRNFIARYYYTSSSQGEAEGASLAALYAPQVNFYGQQRSSADILHEKYQYNLRWDGRRYTVRDDSMRVNCNSSGQVCRATGYVDWDFSSSSHHKVSRGVSSFDFLILNARSNPKVVGESSKVEQRY